MTPTKLDGDYKTRPWLDFTSHSASWFDTAPGSDHRVSYPPLFISFLVCISRSSSFFSGNTDPCVRRKSVPFRFFVLLAVNMRYDEPNAHTFSFESDAATNLVAHRMARLLMNLNEFHTKRWHTTFERTASNEFNRILPCPTLAVPLSEGTSRRS